VGEDFLIREIEGHMSYSGYEKGEDPVCAWTFRLVGGEGAALLSTLHKECNTTITNI
jgi:hypothetical protein